MWPRTFNFRTSYKHLLWMHVLKMVVLPVQYNLQPSIWNCRLVRENEDESVNIRVSCSIHTTFRVWPWTCNFDKYKKHLLWIHDLKMVVIPVQHNLQPSIWGCRLVRGNEDQPVNIRDNLVYISHLECGLGLETMVHLRNIYCECIIWRWSCFPSDITSNPLIVVAARSEET